MIGAHLIQGKKEAAVVMQPVPSLSLVDGARSRVHHRRSRMTTHHTILPPFTPLSTTPPSSRSTSSVWSSQAERQCSKERKTHCWSSMAGDDDHLRIQDEQNPHAHPARIPPPCQQHLT